MMSKDDRNMTPAEVDVRIGELSRRVGVSPEVLRSWEQRYGLLHPARTSGGYRLYGREDEARARRMKDLIASGHAPAEAASAIAAPAPEPPLAEAQPYVLATLRAGLQDALLRMDAAGSHERIDRLIAAHTLDSVLEAVVLPLLREIGDRWATAEVSVAQEHFASELLAGRLRGLGRGWDDGLGPRAVLACPGGERHDLGLLCFGLTLHQRGWRVTYLGADTPVHGLTEVAARVEADLVVLSAVATDPLHRAEEEIAALAIRVEVALGGAGAHPRIAQRTGARLLAEHPVAAARELSAAWAS
jgi:DNA-binding transcriptional MerR regulator